MVKNPPANAGDMGSISDLGRFPGGGNANPLQYSCLENPMDRKAWQAVVHRVTKSQTQLKQLLAHAFIYCILCSQAAHNCRVESCAKDLIHARKLNIFIL